MRAQGGSMKKVWVRAKILEGGGNLDEHMGHLRGKRIWVGNERPGWYRGTNCHGQTGSGVSVPTNLGGWRSRYNCIIPADCIELLSEYAEYVQTIPFHVWSDPAWPGGDGEQPAG